MKANTFFQNRFGLFGLFGLYRFSHESAHLPTRKRSIHFFGLFGLVLVFPVFVGFFLKTCFGLFGLFRFSHEGAHPPKRKIKTRDPEKSKKSKKSKPILKKRVCLHFLNLYISLDFLDFSGFRIFCCCFFFKRCFGFFGLFRFGLHCSLRLSQRVRCPRGSPGEAPRGTQDRAQDKAQE